MNLNKVAQAVQGLINGFSATGIVAALGISGALLLVALILVAARRRWVGLGLGIISLVAALTVLVIVDQQTITIRESESVSVTRPRYPERTRSLARMAMLGLPGVVVLVALSAWASARHRLRLSVPRLMKQGRMHLFSKEYEPALAAFSKAIRISHFLADAYCGRGAAYQGLGDLDRALDDYNQAIEYDPRSTHAFIQRARIRSGTGDTAGALADLNRVMELLPNDPELYLNRGICFFQQGLMVEAASDLHRVLKLTNHTDYAEPAKDFLRQIDDHVAGLPYTSPLQPPAANGIPGPEALPQPKAKDHTT